MGADPGLSTVRGMPEAVIVATARSPIGRAFKGRFEDMRPDDLAATDRAGRAGQGPAAGPGGHRRPDAGLRAARRRGGLQHGPRGRPSGSGYDYLPGTTVNRYCSSSLQTTRMAFHAIKAGEGDVFISAGVETVSRVRQGQLRQPCPTRENPVFADAKARTATRGGRGRRRAGTTRARTARCPTSTSRWARPPRTSPRCAASPARSRTSSACAPRTAPRRRSTDGFFEREITPVTLPDGTVVDTDDGPRAGTTVEELAQLKPVFRPDGTVTAGQRCPLNDGAAAVVVMSEHKARELGLTPLARIVATGVTGAVTRRSWASARSRRRGRRSANAGMTIDDIDLVEINEAFAAQVIPSYRDLGIDQDKLNVHGGAIALGHPFGMTGARITARCSTASPSTTRPSASRRCASAAARAWR